MGSFNSGAAGHRLSIISGCRAALLCGLRYSVEAGELGELQFDTALCSFMFRLLWQGTFLTFMAFQVHSPNLWNSFGDTLGKWSNHSFHFMSLSKFWTEIHYFSLPMFKSVLSVQDADVCNSPFKSGNPLLNFSISASTNVLNFHYL